MEQDNNKDKPKHEDPFNIVRMFLNAGQPELAKKAEEELAKSYPKLAAKITHFETELELNKFVTVDKDMIALQDKVRILSNCSDPVLICGETGTGKEILARALHGRRSGKFVAVNCTSLPDELLESELFGHKKGSFTGAIEERIGKFQFAHNGTILLDEIGDMNMGMQTKLLRVLQDKKIVQLGDNVERDVNFRLVCSTNKDVSKVIREDLLWRIGICRLDTKPLRERRDDIPEIVKALRKKESPEFPSESLSELAKMELRGNVRELQAIVRRWELFEERP